MAVFVELEGIYFKSPLTLFACRFFLLSMFSDSGGLSNWNSYEINKRQLSVILYFLQSKRSVTSLSESIMRSVICLNLLFRLQHLQSLRSLLSLCGGLEDIFW